MLSILDIIIISLGSVCVILYAIFSIRKAILYNREYKDCLKSGMTQAQAKEYCKKHFSKKKNKYQNNDKIYEE